MSQHWNFWLDMFFSPHKNLGPYLIIRSELLSHAWQFWSFFVALYMENRLLDRNSKKKKKKRCKQNTSWDPVRKIYQKQWKWRETAVPRPRACFCICGTCLCGNSMWISELWLWPTNFCGLQLGIPDLPAGKSRCHFFKIQKDVQKYKEGHIHDYVEKYMLNEKQSPPWINVPTLPPLWCNQR